MTAIVGITDGSCIWMGADSIGINTDTLSTTTRLDEKVFVNGPCLIAFCGSYRMGALLRYNLQIPEKPEGVSDVAYMNVFFVEAVRRCFKDGGHSTSQSGREFGGKFFVGYNGKIYIIDSDYQVGISADNYVAAGCGADLCLGSLHTTNMIENLTPEQRINLSLEAAENFNGGVKGPFVILKMGNEKPKKEKKSKRK